MRQSYRPLAAAIAGSALVLALTLPVVPGFLGTAPAFAKDGNSGGHSNAGGNGGGNSGGGGQSPAASSLTAGGPGQSGNAPGHLKLKKIDVASTSEGGVVPAVTGKNKTKGLDAQIGALHAVHANLQAFIHANPNSRVGRIAAYAKSTIAVEGLTQDLADKLAQLAASQIAVTDAETAFGGSTELADFAVVVPGDAVLSFTELQDRLATLSTADPLTLTPDETTELAALTTLLNSQPAMNLAAATQTAADLATEAETTQALLDAAEQTAADALAAAGNKPITDAVKAYVDAALQDGGVLDYYRTQ